MATSTTKFVHDLLIGNITKTIDNMIDIYGKALVDSSFDAVALSRKILPYLKERAGLSVYNVTKSMAKTMTPTANLLWAGSNLMS